MSQKTTRKTAVNEEKEKEKRQTDSPVKEMKKKMAANAEKEKQAAEKVEKAAEKATEKQTEKNTEKNADKPDKTAADKKTEKSTEKHTDSKKSEKSMEKISEKPAEKADKSVPDKKPDKNVEKKDPPAEKSKEDGNKEDKSGKSEISDQKKPDNKAKQNGREARAHNGVSDVTLSSNGVADDVLNGTVSADSEDDDVMLVIDDQDQDELFPELTYDDGSDVECFEPPTPESAPSRSFTRRSQPKDSKVLKLNEAPPTDRKLRSADSPKPESKKETKKPEKDSPKKQESATEKESPKKQESAPEKEAVVEIVQESEKKDSDNKSQEDSEKRDAVEMEVVIEVEADASEESRKPDTNYSKSRVKVSPYRRSMRIADQTNSSLLANYTGNNTTMEMDISETSSFMSEDAALDDSSYLRGLRSIRGRNSYKPLKDITLRHVSANRSARAAATASESQASGRPTGTVVGRKRKPELADAADVAEVNEPEAEARGKRMRLLERLAVPFRRNTTRNAEIVGINTDLPLTAPVASADSFDPETLKPIPVIPADAPVAVPLAPSHEDRDNKRCLIM